ALKTYPLYLGTGSAGADASSTTTQDKKTEVELAQLGEKVKKTQDAFKKTQDAIKKTQEAVENILETVASQKAELDDSKNAWEQEVATLRELVATMKMDIENGKEDLKKAKSELDNNKIKVIETLGIFTALFALITNASNGWPAPMFVAFAAIIFVFLFLLHFLLTGNEKVIETAKPIFRYSLILLILSLGIFIGSSWRSWLPENFVGIQFIFPERSEEAPLSLDSETPPATISPAVEIDAASD
ncbi:hypothetical protein EBT31_19290, partial [bacterium]|nr:hypothetical protein [bacterium]